MRSYAEREIFSTYAVAIWMDAVTYVARVGASWGNELRCHELARATCLALTSQHAIRLRTWKVALTVVDGRVGAVEHSWIAYEPLGQPYRDSPRAWILDVYCPGRLPQVQLIDGSSTISRDYVTGAPREDIDHAIVEDLVRQMLRAVPAPHVSCCTWPIDGRAPNKQASPCNRLDCPYCRPEERIGHE